MAELSYDDVRRAAQDALRDIQSIVYGLQNSHNDLKRTVQNNNSQYQLNDIANRLNTVQQQVNALTVSMRSNNSGAQPTAIHYSMQQSLNDLHRRLGTVEEFVQFCYRYFENLQRQETEQQGYRKS
jgi:hypothetical protein